MTGHDTKKQKYATPVLMPLGQVASGAGACGTGGAVTNCTNGNGNQWGTCGNGNANHGDTCSNGTGHSSGRLCTTGSIAG